MNRYNFKSFLSRHLDKPEELDLFTTLEYLPKVRDGRWIAGGAIRDTLQGLPITSDIDYFVRNKEEKERFIQEMSIEHLRAEKISENDHNITWMVPIPKRDEKIKVQLIIINYYETLEDVLDTFDFTITQFGYDGTTLVCGEYSLWDLARRRLAIHKVTYGVSTVRRMMKYMQKGFTACGGCISTLLLEISSNPSKIEADIQYID